jgi:hypothetical protein
MVALFVVGSGIALLWSAVRYQIVYRSLIDSFPPQFQDDLTSRYAFPVLALSPSTPLPLQAEYVKASWGACVGLLCIAMCFFSIGELIVGCVGLVIFFAAVFSTINSWKTYRENCNRVVPNDDNDGP